MKYELVRDANGKIENVIVNGKAVKKSFVNALKKAQTTTYFREFSDSATFTNPFSGESFDLNPLEATIYNFCNKWYQMYSYRGVAGAGAPVPTFDNMKYFLLFLNSKAYNGLID